MSKSILVIDTPENCVKCPCFLEVATDCCGVNGENIDGYSKPDWYPLKELPKKRNVPSYLPDLHQLIADGYNSCIDEILKGVNGNDERSV